jgi:formate/nitrite transporter FocA (FNT family)
MAELKDDRIDRGGDGDTEHDAAIQSLTRGEELEAIERAGPRAPVVYASISARGLEEINRPMLSLVGSGFASGLIMMVSVIAEGILHGKLPGFEGRALVADLGYTIGFLIVILGRMQLFTENTITPVLPLLANPSRNILWRTGRLWGLVFAANMAGTFVAALMLVHGAIISPLYLQGTLEISQKVIAHTPMETLRYGVIAGFLIAALVWCMPTARGSEFPMIFFITYMIAAGDFTHVVAGSAEGFLLLFSGDAGLGLVLFGLILPALVGNVLGGTLLFAALAYVQVMEEISAESRRAKRTPLERAPEPRSGVLPGTGGNE